MKPEYGAEAGRVGMAVRERKMKGIVILDYYPFNTILTIMYLII